MGSAGEEHFHGLLRRDGAADGHAREWCRKRPIWTPGVAKAAVSAATARSQVATNWHPAAVASPCTWAMTGLGRRRINSMTRVQSAKTPE